jgi:hypothetical protein
LIFLSRTSHAQFSSFAPATICLLVISFWIRAPGCAAIFDSLFVFWYAPWEVFRSWFSLHRETLQLMFSSSPVAASLILILLLLNSATHVGNLLIA